MLINVITTPLSILGSISSAQEATKTVSTSVKQFFTLPFEEIFKKIIFLLLVALIGLIAIKYTVKIIGKLLTKTKIDSVLHPLILSVTKILLIVLLFITCVSIVIPSASASLITALGAVGLAVSLAVQSSLSNLAGGIVVLVSKPFNLGDYVDIGENSGSVTEIGFAYTVLTTVDNKKIMIPNSDISTARIVNYSSEENRRLDLGFSIGYNDDIKKAKSIIYSVIEKSGLAITEPDTPIVLVSEHGASSITLLSRTWVKANDYWNLRFFLLEEIKYAFDKEGINIPYNQLDVHVLKN